MRIGIIGAGHAGLAAAAAAGKAGAETTLFSNETSDPYFRPRLVAVAFGQATPEETARHPLSWYERNGIRLRLQSGISGVDPANMTVTDGANREQFDAIVFATGAEPVRPGFCRDCASRVSCLWTMEDAVATREMVRNANGMLLIGGGLIGIEAALRARDAGLAVTMVEKADRLLPQRLGISAAAATASCLEENGVRVITGASVVSMLCRDNNAVVATLDNGKVLDASFALIAVGAIPNTALARSAGLRTGKGILADSSLQTSARGIFACGDAAQIENRRLFSATEASAQGDTAGRNAAALLSGDALRTHETRKNAGISLKYGNFELHSAGDIPESGDEELPLDVDARGAYAARIVRNGATVGVQMVGTGKRFMEYAGEIRA